MAKKRITIKISNLDAQADRILALQRQNDIITLLLEGKDTKTIVRYIVNKYRVTAETLHKDYLVKAREEIKLRMNYELKTLVPLHISRYEYVYEKLYEMGSQAIAMGALRAKEKLMQFHKEGFHLRVTQGQLSQVSTMHIANEYDHMKMPEVKRKRMQELMEIVKRPKMLKQ